MRKKIRNILNLLVLLAVFAGVCFGSPTSVSAFESKFTGDDSVVEIQKAAHTHEESEEDNEICHDDIAEKAFVRSSIDTHVFIVLDSHLLNYNHHYSESNPTSLVNVFSGPPNHLEKSIATVRLTL